MTKTKLVEKIRNNMSNEDMQDKTTSEIASAIGMPVTDMISLFGDSDEGCLKNDNTFSFNGGKILKKVSDFIVVINEMLDEGTTTVDTEFVVSGPLIPLYYTIYGPANMLLALESDMRDVGVRPGDFRSTLTEYLNVASPYVVKVEDDFEATWTMNRTRTVNRLKNILNKWDTFENNVKVLGFVLVSLVAACAFDSGMNPSDFLEQAKDAGISELDALSGLIAGTALVMDEQSI